MIQYINKQGGSNFYSVIFKRGIFGIGLSMFFYTYPLICLIQKVLQKIDDSIKSDNAIWPRRPLYTDLLQLGMAIPKKNYKIFKIFFNIQIQRYTIQL